MFKRLAIAIVHRLQHWLELDDPYARAEVSTPFDNSYEWIRSSFRRLIRDPETRTRPYYLWGSLQAAALGKVLGMTRISVIEFGVAGGAGLLALERCAELVEEVTGLTIEVYGFDTGTGLPNSKDYRDCPYLWKEGFFPMDKTKLEGRLRRAKLHLGLVEKTLPEFLGSGCAPVAFISFDLDLYSSTKGALRILGTNTHQLLPRVFCYFDDILGHGVCEYNGERLAIAEFNAEHVDRKIAPMYGLKHWVTWEYKDAFWTEAFYLAHCFEHPLYNERASGSDRTVIDIDGRYVSPERSDTQL